MRAVPAGALHQHVGELRVRRQPLVGGQGPGRGGPGDQEQRPLPALAVARPHRLEQGVLVRGGEAHVHGGRLLVLVLHLRLRQGGAAVEAPVNGLEAALQVAGGDHFAQGPHGVRLGAVVHGQVRRIPVAQHP